MQKIDRTRRKRRYLVLSFFVPFGVGLMVSYRAIADNLPAIVVASVVSTALVIAVIGLVYQKMNKRV